MNDDISNQILTELQLIRILLQLSSKDLKSDVEKRLNELQKIINLARANWTQVLEGLPIDREKEAGYRYMMENLQKEQDILLMFNQQDSLD
jgi:hypothetical protein